MPIQDTNKNEFLSKKNNALLNWIVCESGVHNLTHDPKECIRLFNIYKQVCKEK
jgi:hypothetical protein